MATYGYARVSTAAQANEGDSLPAQERMIEGHAKVLGRTLDRVFVERGVSGSKPFVERQEGAKLLAALQPGDAIIACKLDRMFRSARDALNVLEDLRAKRVSLYLLDMGAGDCTGNGIAAMVFTILAAVAQMERHRVAERVADVIADKRKRGLHVGGMVPTGFTVNEATRALVPDKGQQKAIAHMVKLRAADFSWREIAERVAEKDGLKVSHETCRKLVTEALAKRKPRARAAEHRDETVTGEARP